MTKQNADFKVADVENNRNNTMVIFAGYKNKNVGASFTSPI